MVGLPISFLEGVCNSTDRILAFVLRLLRTDGLSPLRENVPVSHIFRFSLLGLQVRDMVNRDFIRFAFVAYIHELEGKSLFFLGSSSSFRPDRILNSFPVSSLVFFPPLFVQRRRWRLLLCFESGFIIYPSQLLVFRPD
uniref:Uncharacterized protein n=1 Tax=Strombidium inclinatum TaxID=197538 RepID=A0A7S3MW62_9SPIT